MRDALLDSPAPVVAVSPIVGGAVLKGPTAAFMAADGYPPTAAGIASCYAGLIDGLVADERGRRRAGPADRHAHERPREPAPRRRRDAALRRGTREWPTDAPHPAARAARPSGPPTLAILPVKRFGIAKVRLGDELSGGTRRAIAEAMVTDVLMALRRTSRVVRGPARDLRAGGGGDRPRLRRQRARRRPRGRPERRHAHRRSRTRSRQACRACCSCPATCPRSIPPSSTRCSTARRRAARSSSCPTATAPERTRCC